MTKTAHGYIENVEFTAAEDGDGLWTVRACFVFSCPSEIRLPVTFSILGKAQKYSIRDLYAHEELGEFEGSYVAKEVPVHGVQMLRMKPVA